MQFNNTLEKVVHSPMLKLTIRWTNSFVVSCCENVSALFLNLLRSLLIIKRKKKHILKEGIPLPHFVFICKIHRATQRFLQSLFPRKGKCTRYRTWKSLAHGHREFQAGQSVEYSIYITTLTKCRLTLNSGYARS